MSRLESIPVKSEADERNVLPQISGGGELEACIEKAESLLEILVEEAEILRRFSGSELLELLPQKERLSAELREDILRLEEVKWKDEACVIGSSGYGLLQVRLKEIMRINESNLVFISETLSHYTDLLGCFRPSSYGPDVDESAKQKKINCKGMMFTKEA
ncbi:MAG: hypothetical protein AB2L11_09935 [Syntrophobacteraceae bacterium]